MSDSKDVSPISQLTGMNVVSLASGNALGRILEPFIDPISGVLLGVSISLADGSQAGLTRDEIYSFGRDAVMVNGDGSVVPLDDGILSGGQPASKLIGTKIITESGDVLGQISNIFVTLRPPPRIIYEAGQSIFDKLLGRTFFVPASVGYALSDDGERLVVPDTTVDIAASDLDELVDQDIEVRSFQPGDRSQRQPKDDDTIVVIDEEQTVVRLMDDEETVVRLGDDDDTVIRR